MAYRIDADWRAGGNTNGDMGGKEGFCVHHAAGTSIDMAGTFLARGTSAHYGVEPGHVRQFVEDRNNAWAAGHRWANDRLVHVECVNSAAGGGWPVAEATVDTLVEFLADKCREYGWPRLDVGENLYGHRDFSATECPGVLYARLGEIAGRVNNLLNGEDDMNACDVWEYPIGEGEAGKNDVPAWMRLGYVNQDTALLRAQLLRTDDAGTGDGTSGDLYTRLCWTDKRVRELAEVTVPAMEAAIKALADADGADGEAVAAQVAAAVAAKLATIELSVTTG